MKITKHTSSFCKMNEKYWKFQFVLVIIITRDNLLAQAAWCMGNVLRC